MESGLNDGLCVPLFLIAIAFADAEEGTTPARSAVTLVLGEIGYGLVGGVAAGVLGGLALRLATRRRSIEPHWVQILTVSSTLGAAGVATALGGSIFIAAFTAGLVFGALRPDRGAEVTYLVDECGELFNAITFVVFGAVILGPALDELTWELAIYAVLSLTIVRMLPVAVAMIGSGARVPTLAVLGCLGRAGWPRSSSG